MKFKPVNYLKTLFDNKKFLIAFSLICAVIFWLVIDIAENPTREVNVSGISVAVANQTDDNGKELMTVGEYQNEVSVTVKGPGYIVSNVTADDISVSVVSYADVNQPGTYVLNLSASVDLNGCSVVKITPSYIKVDYDYDTTADIPVEVDISGFRNYLDDNKEIYKSTLKNNADGSDITFLNVTGPSEVIGSISKVVATPVLPSEVEAKTQNFSATLVFYDTVGNPVDTSMLVYNTDYYVRVVVYKVAEVTLVPTFTNLPQCYSAPNSLPKINLYRYNETAKSTQKLETVTVRGPIDAIDGLVSTGLPLAPIDFMMVTRGNTDFNVSFALTDGVEVVDGTEEVKVSIELNNLRTATFTISPSKINFTGLNGLTASSALTNKSISVTVCYDRNKHTKVSADSFVLTVDCSDVTAAASVTKTISLTTTSSDIYAWANVIDPNETIVIIK